MAFLNGIDRTQFTYVTTCLDQIIDDNNPVRAVDAFVDAIDMVKVGFVEYEGNNRGQRPYKRSELLKLHVYGYLNGVRSSRKLEIEAKRNIEVMWLINSLTPDHGTISMFMKDNKDAFRKVLKEFTLVLKGWGLIDGKLVAIDGTKLKAQNSKHNYITPSVLEKKLQYAEEQIDTYIRELEKADNGALNTAKGDIQSKIDTYIKMKDEYIKQKEYLQSKDLNQVCLTDKEARGMKNNGKFEVCYNVQSAVDSKNNLVVDCETVNDINDLNQLSNMALNAKKLLRKRKIMVVADTGYYNSEEIKKCIDKKVTLFVKKPKLNNKTGNDDFRKDKFIYRQNEDVYICPEGNSLTFTEYTTKNATRYKRYKCTDCKTCPKKSLCTTAKEGRNIQRWIFEDLLDNLADETSKNNDIYKRRRCIVEHPFGTIKRTLGYTYFLRRGLESVNAEAASIFVAYNLKRLINIIPVIELVKKFRQLAIS